MDHPMVEHDISLLAADIIAAFVSNNAVQASDLPDLIHAVHSTLHRLVAGEAPKPEPVVLEPAVPVKKSITRDAIICLDCGKSFKSMRRHLSTNHGMTPETYIAKWDLSKDYPMVAPSYAAARSEMAKASGLGSKRLETVAEPAQVMPKRKVGRPKLNAA